MKSDNIPDILRMASISSVAFPLVSYLFKVRSASKPVHLIGGLIVFSALSDLAGSIFFAKGQSTVEVFNAFYIVQFLLLAAFYHAILNSKTGRVLTLLCALVFLMAFVLITMYVQGFSEYQTFVWTLSGLMMIIFSISYFVHLFASTTLSDNYAFLWINGGILYYFSFNLFLFLMSSYVLTKMESPISMLFWSFHNANNIIKNVLCGFGIASFTVNNK